MDEKTQIVYAEVWDVLKYFDKDLVMKIPIEVLEYFKENRKKDYDTNIDREDIFNKENMSKEALAILAYFNMEYWSDDEHKKELIEMYRRNENNTNLEKNNKFDSNILFNNKQNETKTANPNILPEKYKESLWKRIINKIRKIMRVG